MKEEAINIPISEKIKEILKRPSIICVTPIKKRGNILNAEDNSSSDDWGFGNWNDNSVDSNYGYDYGACAPSCSPCSPCNPNTVTYQCIPEEESCYPDCSPCNPCYPCNPIDEHDRRR